MRSVVACRPLYTRERPRETESPGGPHHLKYYLQLKTQRAMLGEAKPVLGGHWEEHSKWDKVVLQT